VQGIMVRRANRDQIGGHMRATIAAQAQVVHVEKSGVPAAGHAAAVVVALHHGAADRRWGVLLGASAHVGVCRVHVGVRCADVGVRDVGVLSPALVPTMD